ncbi:hypothetical protein TNCV_1033681 [Trichonephila clavipes]|nr:hypothetical protein TNCV_1033681 [Trichonephila clavipes]
MLHSKKGIFGDIEPQNYDHLVPQFTTSPYSAKTFKRARAEKVLIAARSSEAKPSLPIQLVHRASKYFYSVHSPALIACRRRENVVCAVMNEGKEERFPSTPSVSYRPDISPQHLYLIEYRSTRNGFCGNRLPRWRRGHKSIIGHGTCIEEPKGTVPSDEEIGTKATAKSDGQKAARMQPKRNNQPDKHRCLSLFLPRRGAGWNGVTKGLMLYHRQLLLSSAIRHLPAVRLVRGW